MPAPWLAERGGARLRTRPLAEQQCGDQEAEDATIHAP